MRYFWGMSMIDEHVNEIRCTLLMELPPHMFLLKKLAGMFKYPSRNMHSALGNWTWTLRVLFYRGPKGQSKRRVPHSEAAFVDKRLLSKSTWSWRLSTRKFYISTQQSPLRSPQQISSFSATPAGRLLCRGPLPVVRGFWAARHCRLSWPALNCVKQILPTNVQVVSSQHEILVFDHFPEEGKAYADGHVWIEIAYINRVKPPTELCSSYPKLTASIAVRYFIWCGLYF